MAATTKVLGLLILAVAAAVGENDDYKTRCPSLALTYITTLRGNTCYQFYYGHKTWKDARDYCWQNGGRLVKINDPGTHNFLKGKLRTMGWNTDDLWIGLNDMDDELEWQWVGNYGEPGEKMTWSAWHEDHPEGWFHEYRDCIKMSNDGGDWTWHEVTCNVNPFSYRFICEYEATDPSGESENVEGGVGGHLRTTPSTPTTTFRASTTTNKHSTYFTRYGGGGGGGRDISGEHRKVSGFDSNYNGDSSELLEGEHSMVFGEGQEEDDGGVPLYAVIISFGAGVVCAAFIILFIVIRRRRRKKARSETFPSVVYHSQQSAERSRAVGGGGAGAAGVIVAARDPTICSMTGRPCKMAVNMSSQKCVCEADHETMACGQGHSSNMYVSISEEDFRRKGLASGISADPLSDGSNNRGPSVTSSMRDMSSMDEQPPTYDEVCGAAAETTEPHEANARAGNLYTHEPHQPPPLRREVPANHRSVESLRQQEEGAASSPRHGAIPKTPKDTYLPMNGSPKSQGHSRTNSATLYVPMSLSLGELPPIPTDDGYEIPVTTRLEPEAVKSLRSPIEETITPDGEGPSSIYSEIPDRSSRCSRLLHNGDQIYATID